MPPARKSHCSSEIKTTFRHGGGNLTRAGRIITKAPAARLAWQPILALLAFAGSMMVAVWAGQIGSDLSVFWLMGMAFGFVLQRSRFCFASGFRDLFLLRDGRVMKGIIAGMVVATGGFTLVMSDILPNARLDLVAYQAHVSPLALGLVVGGLVFGLGMVLAGGCVSGSIYRMAEGYLGSWVTFVGIMTGLVVVGHTWNWWWRMDIGLAPRLWLPNLAGYGSAMAATLVALVGAYIFILWWESRGGLVIPYRPATEPPADTFGEKLRQSYRAIFVHGWPATTGGLVLGALNVYMYSYEHPWRITGEISVWGNALAARLGLAQPPLLGIETLTGCTMGGSQCGLLNHMALSNLGLFTGALVAALLAQECKLRVPRKKVRYFQSLGGGLLMGYGAGLAVGCTVGAFFSAIPSLAANGWIFAIALAGGAFLGTKALRWLP